jgi:hypothetical protein
MNFDFIKKAFSDNGTPSSSRILTVPHSLAAIFVMIFVAVKTHTYPDAVQAGGLGAFATIHYTVNRVTTAWGKDRPEDRSEDKSQDNK